MNNWAQHDPGGAGKFIETLPEGKSRDATVQTYVNQLAWQSPEMAAPFVSQIADVNQRFSLAQNVANNYKRTDPAGYARWVATLNLPEDKLKFMPK